METGRNAPCPCGSGRKYKHCCLKTLQPDRDAEWRRLGEVYARLDGRMRRFMERTLGRTGLEEAYDEFLMRPDDIPDEEFLHCQGPLFCSWCIFNWFYDPRRSEVELDLPPGRTLAELFVEKEGKRLSDTEKELIEAISRTPFSFHEIVRIDPGRGFALRDVLTGEEVDVLERAGSAHAREGDILYGRVVRVAGMAMLYGCGGYAIPQMRKPSIIDLRKRLRRKKKKIEATVLADCEEEIRGEYVRLSSSLFRGPVLCNTDGELMEFRTLHYEIDSPERAFSGLASLSVLDTESTLRSTAKLDEDGGIRHVEIPWTREGRGKSALDTTILGFLTIDGRSLKVEVNSAGRQERIQKEIEARLGPGARYKTTVIRSADYMMKEIRRHAPRKEARETEHDRLMQIPEVRERMAALFAAHWSGWADEKIPALGGKTPRQAVKTADGRESVEALLRSAERDAAGDRHISREMLEALEGVRRTLGLPRR